MTEYGWRARIGTIVPSVNSCSEPQFRLMAPDGVEFYVTRLPLRRGTREELVAMADAAVPAARLLADVGPDLILFHCTAATVIGGRGYGEAIARRISAETGRPALVTSIAVVEALRALDARRVTLVTPYDRETTEAEADFVRAYGFEVAAQVALELEPAQFPAHTPDDWRATVAEAVDDDADAIFLSCTNIRAIEAIAAIERATGRPVVTSNQASLWCALRSLGIDDGVPGYGRLLESSAQPVARAGAAL
jgi:maleate isomerase